MMVDGSDPEHVHRCSKIKTRAEMLIETAMAEAGASAKLVACLEAQVRHGMSVRSPRVTMDGSTRNT